MLYIRKLFLVILLSLFLPNAVFALTLTTYLPPQIGTSNRTNSLSTSAITRDSKSSLINKVIYHSRKPHSIMLTFDDGPHPGFTPRLLAILKENQVTATFFVVGKQVAMHPDLLREIAQAGHTIGNHTYDHVRLITLNYEAIRTQYRRCNEAITAITGVSVNYSRPPGGRFNDRVISASLAEKLTPVHWTVDPSDYASPGGKIIEARIFRHIRSGGIILLHNGVEQTLELLPDLIAELRKRGYTFVTP